MNVVALAGGTGGAKLAAGLQEVAGAGLTVIANTGDDVEALGVHVSPDPDLCTYWLCGEIDEERGWGIRGDGFTVFERLTELGAPDWFGLSDRDLATCLERRRRLELGDRPTAIAADLARALGAEATVLPMCDEPVRTLVRTAAGRLGLQEFLVRERAEPEIEAVELRGIEAATVSAEVAAAIGFAEVIVIGPSNPVISIGPILAVPGMKAAIADSAAPVVAVSPFVAGAVVKGPTEPFMRAAGMEPSAAGIAGAYGEVADGLIVDAADPGPGPAHDGLVVRRLDTLMDGADGRRRVATATLELATELGG
ncbi:MAG TPA: 2-phospho-L-lactate transferase [Solirubrobacterales bacterium]|nr:2-phospho-L-lactate transferase [Solirubrobacterales bacterium]